MPTLSSRRPGWVLPTVVFVLFSVIGVGVTTGKSPSPIVPDSRVERASPTGLQIGVTHTQVTARHGDESGLTEPERRLLAQHQRPQNQHIMGWGAGNPEPRPGEFRWASLDQRIELIRDTDGIPIITLCCAPDWMKGGRPGETNWTLLERAPEKKHYGDFAALAAQVAQRYPDVKFFQVWNEMKGFYDRRRNTWDSKAYTQMYNQVYDAVKAVRPDAKVGGPYVAVDGWSSADAASHPSSLRGPWGVVDQRALDAIVYWLEHNAGADFFTISMSTSTNDAGFVTDPFTALGKLTTVVRWVRGRTTLPIWIAEWYPLPEDAAGDLARQDAIISASLAAMIDADVAMVLLWRPRRASPSACQGCLWTADGGEPAPTPLFASIAEVAAMTEQFMIKVVMTGDVRMVTSRQRTFFVNTAPHESVARHDGTVITLGPYETKMRDSN